MPVISALKKRKRQEESANSLKTWAKIIYQVRQTWEQTLPQKEKGRGGRGRKRKKKKQEDYLISTLNLRVLDTF